MTKSGGEQSAQTRLVGSDRVLAVLRELAAYPQGVTLDEMARAIASPKPTVHRALAALRRAGLAAQDARGRYLLGDEFLRMAFAYHEARPDEVRVQPILDQLCARYGETVHYAVLDGRSIVYRAKIDPPVGGLKLTSTVGGRNPAHTTAVGKLLLAQVLPSADAVRAWIGDRPLEKRTAHSVCTAAALHEQLVTARRQGYAVDDEENEPGITCLAVPAYLNSPTVPSGAISISALAHRTPLQSLIDDLAAITKVTRQL